MVSVDRLEVHAFTVPTDGPGSTEQDGTATWTATTMVLVTATGGGRQGIGYTYGSTATARLIADNLAGVVIGADALAPSRAWAAMLATLRNAGRPGVGSMAIAAVDIALWDLASNLRDMALFRLLPSFHDSVPVYGSGGFTNYPTSRLARQLSGWVERGIGSVKIKTSREPDADAARLDTARDTIGDDVRLFVDANGALGRKQARYWAERFAGEWDVRWFEEPVTSDDLAGLAWLRAHGPSNMDIAAGEYGYVVDDFVALLDAGAVDCLQADVTRCCGITGLLQVAALASARHTELSAHCAPTVSAHAFCAVRRLRHLEYFHDHVRIETMAFDGGPALADGALRPDPDRAGLGIRVRWPDLEPYRVFRRSATSES